MMTEFLDELKQMEQALDKGQGKDDELFNQFVGRIAHLLDQDPNYLMSMLYRLDVEERFLRQAMNDEDPARTIAQLIIKRQLQRIATKKKYSQD